MDSKKQTKKEVKGRLTNHPPIAALSKHLFWDTPQNKVSWEKNGPFLVGRILQYGQMADWRILRQVYGIQGIAEIAMTLRSLDKVTLSFISTIAEIPKEKFRCYTYRQLHPTLWNS